ncbi:hypothetical protein F3F96_01130 [Mariprofundus sp. NF]|uniref:POTRA domain-containing protein n=1 Tax=Mariprofundus sp. NF TaxID=2608716 RepID=UPI0015A16881|nr:POTRA domain-containing protein [Mariprofundus sp. NF]NWF37744.1 hypothetical protein [Mariprofundus sp. NF]
MNSLLHRMIPALLSLSLPFSVQAAETDEPDMPMSETMTQVQPETVPTEDKVSATTETPTDQAITPDTAEATEPLPMAASPMEPQPEATETATLEAGAITAEEEPVDDSFTIATFEIEGNLLLPVETIEKNLQKFVGESRSRDDLFSIRYAIIKLYRSHDLDGVAVAIPTTGEAGTVMVKIFEDDIDAYPQQAVVQPDHQQQAAPEDLAATAPPAEPAPAAKAAKAKAATGPQTYAIKLDPVEKPAVVVLPEPEPELTVEAESAAPADMPESTATVENLLAANESAETAAAEIKEPITQKATPETVVNNDAKEVIVASSPSPKVKPADTVVETTAPIEKANTVAKSAAKPELKATATTAKAATPKMEKAKERAAVNIAHAKAEKANAARAKIEKVKAEKAKAAAAKAEAVKEAAAEEVAVTPILDAQQGTFNISSFEVYGNSLVTTEAIQKRLQPYIGAGKSYADLVDAKQQISQLYRNKGRRMVAVGMPARIFGEAIPVRIYEAKR